MTRVVWFVRWLAAAPWRHVVARRAGLERAIRADVQFFRDMRTRP